MRIARLLPPVLVLGSVIVVSTPSDVDGFALQGFSLSVDRTEFRVHNNFLDASANDNTAGDPSFPGWFGADLAIWKGVIEWSSDPHGDGSGDPSQPELGSGRSNFDPFFAGSATGVGTIGDNIHSAIHSNAGPIQAIWQGDASGWWCRYFDVVNDWSDGPGAPAAGELDLQGTATLLHGYALGLAPSRVPDATMTPGTSTFLKRSIEADDVAGIQSIYGHRDDSGTKPRILSTSVFGDVLQITAENLTPLDNEVWFTSSLPDGEIVKVSGLVSSAGGTQLSVTIPAQAGAGDVMVKRGSNGHASTSAGFPFDPDAAPVPVPDITSLSASTVEALTFTGGESLSIFGTGFLTVDAVTVDATDVGGSGSFAGSYTIVSDTQIDLELPLVPSAGRVDLVVTTPGGTDTTQLEIVAPASPALAIEQPDVVSSVGLDVAVSAEAGDVIFLLFSPLIGPTVVPGLIDWEIGAGNLQAIFVVKGWTIGPNLWRKQHFGPFSGLSAGEDLYFEGWVLEASQGYAEPWDSTNAAARTVTM